MQKQRIQGLALYIGLSIGFSVVVLLASVFVTREQEATLMDPCNAIDATTSLNAYFACTNNADAIRVALQHALIVWMAVMFILVLGLAGSGYVLFPFLRTKIEGIDSHFEQSGSFFAVVFCLPFLAAALAIAFRSVPVLSIATIFCLFVVGILLVKPRSLTAVAKPSKEKSVEDEHKLPSLLSKEEQEQYRQASLAVQGNPQSFEAWANLGYIEHKIGKNEDALISANKALGLNKKSARAWMVRGAALSTMDGQEDKALEALERALIENPNDIDALFYKGNVFMLQGNDNAAHAILDRVLALNPRYREALISKGSAYMVTGNYDELLVTSEKLISRFPDDSRGWIMQGLAYGLPGERKGVPQEKAFDLLT